MTPSADGGQGQHGRPDPVPPGADAMNESIRNAVAEKQANRAGNGRRFNDGHIRGREPLGNLRPAYLDAVAAQGEWNGWRR